MMECIVLGKGRQLALTRHNILIDRRDGEFDEEKEKVEENQAVQLTKIRRSQGHHWIMEGRSPTESMKISVPIVSESVLAIYTNIRCPRRSVKLFTSLM